MIYSLSSDKPLIAIKRYVIKIIIPRITYIHSVIPPRPGHLLQVSWESSIVGGQKLAIGGPQTVDITAEVGAPD